MLRQKTGPATIAANRTSASMPSWSCSLTRCSGEPVPAASATLRPKGCHVPSARPARKSRKLASNSGCPSIIRASPPSGRCTVCGARSRYFSGTRCTQRSGGTSRCPSADISSYCRAITFSLRFVSLRAQRSNLVPVSLGQSRLLRRYAPRNDDLITPRIAPVRQAPGNIRGTRRSQCISSPALRISAAVPVTSAGWPNPGTLLGRGRRNCRSRSRSAPSSYAADLVQQVAQRLLDRLLRLRSRAQKVDLELAFHEVHQLLIALAQMLVPDERIVDPVEIGHDANAGVGFLVIVLRGAGQRVDVREHHRHAEIGGQGLRVGLRNVHQLALVLDPTFAEQNVGVQFAVLALVPDLAGAHALQVDIPLLIGDIDGQQLPRHLLDRHVHAFGGLAAQCAFLLPSFVFAAQLLLDLAERALQRD